ncbi:leucine-rich colipase-like protein 1 [Erinaceus europaeus]|uniref:Leucine-rich colipase-like protein 1 n=1 Tax=Erinaceus europaeus TaxID=9365 RepID=A0ABM3XIE8_ERIEU|nr:leucine-rich colipase-like protein 1 [Erinaceus europaeus]
MVSTWSLLLLLWVLLEAMASRNNMLLSHKVIGEPCHSHEECQSNCCTTNSLNPQKFCTAQTIFLQCLSWLKPNGHLCLKSAECHSNCCTINHIKESSFCTTRNLFLQCVPWRKPHGSRCKGHEECQSRCCLNLGDTQRTWCVPRTGVLALCLPL